MQTGDLLRGREKRGWTQAQAAARLGVSQSYLSRLEQGRRRVPETLARRAVKLFQLPATARPLTTNSIAATALTGAALAGRLAALGYPGLSYLKPRRAPDNPAAVLLAALVSEELEARLAEALPWVAWRYSELDWSWLVKAAKLRDCQNRLGFVIGLARQLAERAGETDKAALLTQQETVLAHSRLAREDTLCRQALPPSERAWLRERRPPEAAFWNLLTDLTAAQLDYAA